RVSRRLRYFSRNQVENRGLVGTSVEATTGGKYRRVNEFAPGVACHQEISNSANFRFDSRRLHHLTSSRRATSLFFDSPPADVSPTRGDSRDLQQTTNRTVDRTRTHVHITLRRQQIAMARELLNRPCGGTAHREMNVCRRMCTPPRTRRSRVMIALRRPSVVGSDHCVPPESPPRSRVSSTAECGRRARDRSSDATLSCTACASLVS